MLTFSVFKMHHEWICWYSSILWNTTIHVQKFALISTLILRRVEQLFVSYLFTIAVQLIAIISLCQISVQPLTTDICQERQLHALELHVSGILHHIVWCVNEPLVTSDCEDEVIKTTRCFILWMKRSEDVELHRRPQWATYTCGRKQHIN
jgi:hypothetical protein